MTRFDANWPGDRVYFAGIFISLSLWGFYVCMFIIMLRKLKAPLNRYHPAVMGTIFVFVLNIVTTVVDIVRVYRFLWDQILYGLENEPLLSVFSDTTFLFSSITGNAIIAWRLYTLWSRDRRVLLAPALALIAIAVEGCLLIAYDGVMVHQPDDASVQLRYSAWAKALYLTELVLSWYMLSMIVERLHWTRAERKVTLYRSILFAFVESGAPFSILLAIYVGFRLAACVNMTMILNFALTRFISFVPVFIILQLSTTAVPKSDAGRGAQIAVRAKDPEAAVQQARVIPNARPHRRDSLSFEFSSDATESAKDVEKEEIQRQVDWVALESGGRLVTVGGTDVAHQLRDEKADVEDVARHIQSMPY